MSWKDTNITNPGTSIKYGADDMELVSRLFNGVTTGVPAVTIKSTAKWGFWDAILYFRNQADTKNITIRGPTNSPSTDIDLTLPPSTANDTLASIGLAQTFAQKQTLTSGAVFTQMTSPSNPGSSKHHLFVASNGHLMKRDNAGLEVDYNLTAPTIPITMESGVLALRDFVRVMKVSTTYYAIKTDGTVLSSGTNPATVIQAVLDLSPPVEVIINAEGSTGWDFLAGFTGLDCKSYNTIHLTGTSNLNMPSGSTAAMFKIAGNRTNITIYSDGGYVNEVAAVSRNWIGVQIGAGDATDNIDNINIRGLVTFTSGDVVKINQGSTGTIESVLLDGLSTDDTRRFITWNVSDATKVKDVTVQNCRPLLDGGSVTDCFKDVKGTRTTFIANTLYGVQGSCNETNIASGAVSTMIFGGNHTGVTGAFTDLGTDTYIDDATHTELKLKGTPVSATISADQNNWSPSGWNEKQNVIRITASGAARTITGLVPGANPKNRIVRLLNVGTFDVILSSENTSSTAANRFKFQTNITMMPNQSTTLLYDSTDSRWRALSDAMAGHAMLTMANTFLEPITIKKDASDLLFLYRPNSTNGINQDLDFDFNDSIGTQVTYCDLRATVVDSTDGSEDGSFQINLMNAGTKNKYFEFQNDASLRLYNNISTVGTNTELIFQARDSGAAQQDYAKIRSEIIDNTAGSEDGKLEFVLIENGSLVEEMILTEANLDLLKGQLNVTRDAAPTLVELYRTDNGGGNGVDMNFYLQSSTGVKRRYGQFRNEIVTATNGAEDGKFAMDIIRAGASVTDMFKWERDGDFTMLHNANTNNDTWGLYFDALSSTSVKRTYASIRGKIIDNTNTSEDSQINFYQMNSGSLISPQRFINSGSINLFHNVNTAFSEHAIEFIALDSGSAEQTYTIISSELLDNTAGSEDGRLVFDCVRGGTVQRVAKLNEDGALEIGRDTNNMRQVVSTVSNSADDIRFVNSSAENTMLSFTVKGSVMDTDSHLVIRAHGYILQNSATGTNYTLRVKVGGTTVYQDVMGGSQAQSAVTKPWWLELRFLAQNQGSTTARMSGLFSMNDTSAPTTGQGSMSDDETQSMACFRASSISWTFANDTVISITVQMDQAQAAAEWQMDGYDADYMHT